MDLNDFFERLADPSKLKGNMPKDVIIGRYQVLREKYPDFVPLTESSLASLAEVLRTKDGGSHYVDRSSVAILLRHEITKRETNTCLSQQAKRAENIH